MAIFDCSRRILLLSMILYLQYTKGNETCNTGITLSTLTVTVDPQNRPCLNDRPVFQTCSGQHFTGKDLNLYHTNLQNHTYGTVCRCTVIGNQGDRIFITFTNGIISCGTNISIFEPRGSIILMHCRTGLKGFFYTLLTANDTISLVFSTVAYSTSSPICIFIQDEGSGSMNVECSSRLPFNGSQDSMPSTKATTTEIAISTVSLESKGAPTSETDEISTMSKKDEISTTILTLSCSATVAVLGVIVLVLLIIVTVVCRRLRKQSNDEEEQTVQYADIQFLTPLPIYEQLAAENRDVRDDNTPYESIQNL